MAGSAAAVSIAIERIGRHEFLFIIRSFRSASLRERKAIRPVVIEGKREVLIHVRKQAGIEGTNPIEACINRMMPLRIGEAESIEHSFYQG